MKRLTETLAVANGERSRPNRPVETRRSVLRATVLFAALGLAGAVICRAQQASTDFAQIVWATWHTGYTGVQRTTVIGPRRTTSFDSRVAQDPSGHRTVEVIRPPGRAGELQVDDGIYRWHYLPRKQLVEIRPSEAVHHTRLEFRRLQPTVTPSGTEVVDGRPTTIYMVTPLRPQAPALRIWVDNQTLVPLKTTWQTRDQRQIVEEYTSISFGGRAPAAFRWPAGAALQVREWTEGGQRAQPGKGLPVIVRMPLALPRVLPVGAVFDGLWRRELAGRQVLFLRIHQGRREASLFETVAASRPDLPNGSIPTGVDVDNWNLGPLNITLVGNLPPPARLRLRASLRMVYNPG